MSIHYDKLTFTKEQVLRDAEELKGIFEEDDTFYSIKFPCNCDHFSDCKDLKYCRKK